MEWKEGEEPAKGVEKDVEAELEGMAQAWSPSKTTYLSAGEQNMQHYLQNPRRMSWIISGSMGTMSSADQQSTGNNSDSGDKCTCASSPD
jgi:hypothetical protein